MLSKKIAVEMLENLDDYTHTIVCEVPMEMFNSEYYIIGTHKAKQFLKRNFEDMLEALKAYQQDVGEVYPYITDPERLATLTALYTAEKIWFSLDVVQNAYDETVGDVICDLRVGLQEYIDRQ